jgi:Reverse transcriptase (RNA-dependent DNA polymerase)
MPFGLKASGNSFCRCFQLIIQPIRDLCYPLVDDMSVCSETWTQHVSHLRSFLTEFRKSGLILSLNKCSLPQNQVRFVGHIIGSGRHRPDEEKVATISDLAKPKTKKDVQ